MGIIGEMIEKSKPVINNVEWVNKWKEYVDKAYATLGNSVADSYIIKDAIAQFVKEFPDAKSKYGEQPFISGILYMQSVRLRIGSAYDYLLSNAPSVSAPEWYRQGFMSFNEAGSGIELKAIPGYPAMLPSLQLAPSGRLCFWNWPKYFTGDNGINYADMSLGIWANNLFVHEQGYDKFVGEPEKGAYTFLPDRSNEKDLVQYYKGCTNSTKYNTQYFLYGMPVIPLDDYLVSTWVKEGKKTNGNPDAAFQTPWLYKSPWTGQLICSVNGKYYYATPSAEKVVQIQMQYYVDLFLKEPYCILEKIPYGENYPYQIWFNAKFNRDSDFVKVLSNIDLLIKPVGEKTFWDKLLAASPVIVSALATIVTLGAGTPALVATAGAMVTGTMVKLNAQQQAMIDKVIAYGKAKSKELNDASNLNVKEVLESTGQISDTGGKNKTTIILIIIIVVLALVYFIFKSKKFKI